MQILLLPLDDDVGRLRRGGLICGIKREPSHATPASLRAHFDHMKDRQPSPTRTSPINDTLSVQHAHILIAHASHKTASDGTHLDESGLLRIAFERLLGLWYIHFEREYFVAGIIWSSRRRCCRRRQLHISTDCVSKQRGSDVFDSWSAGLGDFQ
jgi:hypothetical protein